MKNPALLACLGFVAVVGLLTYNPAPPPAPAPALVSPTFRPGPIPAPAANTPDCGKMSRADARELQAKLGWTGPELLDPTARPEGCR